MIAAPLRLVVVSLGLLGFATPAPAQKFPEHTVRVVVAFPTGASQILGLLVTEKLREAWKQPVVPDFKPGAAAMSRRSSSPRHPPTAIPCFSRARRLRSVLAFSRSSDTIPRAI